MESDSVSDSDDESCEVREMFLSAVPIYECFADAVEYIAQKM